MTDYFETISDTMGISDNQKRDMEKILTDALSTEDSVNKLNNFQRNFTESISLSDPIISPIFQFFTESVSLTDSVNRVIEFQRNISEAESISDTVKDQWLRIYLAYTIFF